MKILKRTQFGNTILRNVTQILSSEQILSNDIQHLIKDMYYTLDEKKYGVGLAAPQVGKSLSLAIVGIKPTPTRPKLKKERLIIINPKIIKTYGYRTAMWEGCISGPNLYAKALRYKKIRLGWEDEKAKAHERDFDGFIGHVIQHEVDHLNGILFVDRVKDPKTYMTFSEYKKLLKSKML